MSNYDSLLQSAKYKCTCTHEHTYSNSLYVDIEIWHNISNVIQKIPIATVQSAPAWSKTSGTRPGRAAVEGRCGIRRLAVSGWAMEG